MNQKGMQNSCYDKVKLLYKSSKILWFIEKHALEDAKKANDEKWYAFLDEYKKDLEKHIEKLKQAIGKDLKPNNI